MPVRFLCPACHQLLAISSRKIGSEVDCPKCRSTIVVPKPHEPANRGGANPFEEAGLEQTLSTLSASDRAAAKSPPTHSSAAAPLLHSRDENSSADDSLIAISRRMLYLQAVLLATVAVVAFLCGYFIGAGK